MGKSRKGGAEERQVAKDVSLWLSSDRNEPSDDHLWRSAGSGARATVRAKRGKGTSGHSGDLSPTTKLGRRFLKVFGVEIKCGYKAAQNATLTDCLDSKPKLKIWTLADWVRQAKRTMRMSKARFWMLIHRRDKRQAIVYMSVKAYQTFEMVYFLKEKKLVGGTVKIPRIKEKVGFMPLRCMFKTDIKLFWRYFT